MTKRQDWANTWTKDFLYRSAHLLASSADMMEWPSRETWKLGSSMLRFWRQEWLLRRTKRLPLTQTALLLKPQFFTSDSRGECHLWEMTVIKSSLRSNATHTHSVTSAVDNIVSFFHINWKKMFLHCGVWLNTKQCFALLKWLLYIKTVCTCGMQWCQGTILHAALEKPAKIAS